MLSPHWMAIPKLVAFATARATARCRSISTLLRAAGRRRFAGAAARGAIAPETRGIYLNTPNNPTGAVLARDQLEAIAEVAIERDLWVVSDEAYEHLLFDGARHVSIASLPGHGGAHA